MGFIKQRMMREEGRGWRGGPDRFVCGECADDEFLAEQIAGSATATKCDYCGAASPDGKPIAAHVDVLIKAVARTVYRYWTDPANVMGHESAEGGYQGRVIHTRELLTDHIGMDWPDELLDDIEGAFTNEVWCERHYYQLDPDDRLKFGWRDFEETTKHWSRYASLLPPAPSEEKWNHSDDVPTSAMLDEVAESIHKVGMIQTLPVGTTLFRVRAHAAAPLPITAKELGAPSPAQAKYPNRMSAAGIAVFYGAFDEPTALVETFDPADAARPMASVAKFQTIRELTVLSLCDLPATPSYFDLDNAELRFALLFLDSFVKSVSRRTVKDGREHIEYVPTQIFAEFVRFRMRSDAGGPIHGIMYPSAQVPGGRCCVLFCDQSACIPPAGEPWERSEQWVSMIGPPKLLHNAACLAAVARVSTPKPHHPS